MSVNVQCHPVGCNPPQILVFPFQSESYSALALSILSEKFANKMTANILNRENITFLALELKISWCKGSDRVRFWVYIHGYIRVFNLQKLPSCSISKVRGTSENVHCR